MYRQFQAKKKNSLLIMLLSALLLLLILFLFYTGISRISASNATEQKQILHNAVYRSITECYSLEGFYPPDLDYLEQNYGLTYDTKTYFVDYQYIGSNILPDVTIITRQKMEGK